MILQIGYSNNAYAAAPETGISISGELGNNGWYTSNVTVSLYASKHEYGILKIEYTFYNESWRDYVMPFTVYEEGQTAVYWRAYDIAGNIESTKQQTIDIDKTPPTCSAIILEGSETQKVQVTLNITANDEPSGPTTRVPIGYYYGIPSWLSDMRFSNNGFVWSTWEPYNSTKDWNLTPRAGEKTVYIQVRDNAGLVSKSTTANVTLITTTDNTPPTTLININDPQSTKEPYTKKVLISFSATDDLSGIKKTEYSYDNIEWTEFKNPFSPNRDGQLTLYYRSIDFNGNVEQTKTQPLTIQEAPSEFPTTWIIIIAVIVVGAVTAIILIRKNKQKTQ